MISLTMEHDIKCFSNYFVNKQNVRSYGNIMHYRILKVKNVECFIRHIFERKDIVMVSPVKSSNKFICILFNLQQNLRKFSQDDFRIYFRKDVDKDLKPVCKEEILCACLKILNNIIPREYFGNNHNMKLLKPIVHKVVYSMKGEHFSISVLLEKWNFDVSPWNDFPKETTNNILLLTTEWIIRYVISAAISLNFYVTTSKLDNDERKLVYFYLNTWQRFYDKSISNLIFAKIIEKNNGCCVGKLVNKDYHNRCELKKLKKEIPKLHLLLKNNSEFRPIVRNRQETAIEKVKSKERHNFLRKLIGKPPIKIEEQYINLFSRWSASTFPLYFVKADLSHAFGCINKQQLFKILNERYINVLRNETNLNGKKKVAQLYKDMIAELRRPLLIRCGSTLYEWKEGLMQGYKYSPALSEIYYNHLDELYFSEILSDSRDSLSFFVRIVDDYLFIADSEDRALSFLKALSNYRNVNYNKTVVNFPHSFIKYNTQITFLGYTYDTLNMQVSRAENVWSGQICYKIAFSTAVANLPKFLESRIGQSSIPVNGHIFNLIYNTEELVWKHVFTTFCLSANKFCTILAILCNVRDMPKYLNLYKRRVAVKLTNTMIGTLKQNQPANVEFYYCINHFRYLSFKALLLCAKQTSKCNQLVPLIRDCLAKCDCIFGKWREHASRIDLDGICKGTSNRAVCKKAEYKKVVKCFETLPNGFQCYNKR